MGACKSKGNERTRHARRIFHQKNIYARIVKERRRFDPSAKAYYPKEQECKRRTPAPVPFLPSPSNFFSTLGRGMMDYACSTTVPTNVGLCNKILCSKKKTVLTVGRGGKPAARNCCMISLALQRGL